MALSPTSSHSSGGGVTVLAVQTFTGVVTLASSTESAGTTVVTAPSFNGDGLTQVCVEFFCGAVDGISTTTTLLCLFEGSTQLTRMAYLNVAGSATEDIPILARYFYTPSVGAHTLKITGTSPSGTARCVAGSGGTAGFPPGYIRITSGG